MTVWDEDTVALLKLLWADGLSGLQISEKIRGSTRNSILGKVHRLGLMGRVRPASFVARKRKPRALGEKPSSKPPYTRGRPKMSTPPVLLVESPLPPSCQPVTMMELRNHHCRWPIGQPAGPATLFCGDRRDVGSYCRFHATLSVTAPRPSWTPERRAAVARTRAGA